jgi:pilus assembly protein CpaE
MASSLRLSICDPNEKTREHLKKYLVGLDRIWLEADCSRYEFFEEVVKQTSPDAVIINIDQNEPVALALIQSLRTQSAGMGIIALSQRTDGQLILRAMRAGAGEFIATPIQIEELFQALDRVSSVGLAAGRNKPAITVAVTGSSGGVGSTTLAVNLACAMARSPLNNVVLVDLDLSVGDADVFLDTIPDYTLLDVSQNIIRLDLALMRKSLTKHDSGVYLLPRPIHLEDMDSISTEDFRKVLALLKASFSHVVLDLSKAYGRLDLVSMQVADHTLLLTQLDLPCLRNVVRILNSMEHHSGVTEKIKVVVNRSGLDRSQISSTNAEETINKPIFWRIPNNFSVVSESRNNGIPLVTQAPKAAITLSINELSDKLCGLDAVATETEAPADKGAKSWLKFLAKK